MGGGLESSGGLSLELPFFLLLRRGHGPLHRPGNASAGSTGASYRPWDHRRTPPHPAARRRDLPDILPMWSTIGQMALSWPSGGERRSARLPREDAPQAGALRGLSGGSDRHQQAEEECASGGCWQRVGAVVCGLVVAPAERPFARHGGAPRIVGVQRAMVSL